MMTNLNDTDRLAVWDQTFITSHPYLERGLLTVKIIVSYQ